ncbi:MAG TPA: hypothetical protein VG897_13775, partial [Terriglobales bacterium]|nr:hypothetical protein [Terriglobales bacterium]
MDQRLRSAPEEDLDLSPPPGLTDGLFRSLVGNFRDRFFPEKLPPLVLTSRPLDVGLLLGDRISAPWFRTIFRNISDVVSPEDLPPLQLESIPIDVGELIGDDLQHGWWTSLLRNLADRVAPERLPTLHLSSAPVHPIEASTELFTPLWSTLIEGPKIYDPAEPRDSRPGVFNLGNGNVTPEEVPEITLEVRLVTDQMRKDIRRGHIR